MSSIRYQPHIDGLRAVAVLLVIFHHLGDWAGLGGGYVGVDVFFVISGFLITSIVRNEVEAGKFSFGGFYKRRVVRLAPAYFVVLFATTIAALIWMLPQELMAYARSMAASSAFLANFYMWKEVGGYFGPDASTIPLLHLWSLAVEEQFYLFWPIVLLLMHRFVNARWLPWLVVAMAVGGAAISQLGVATSPAAAYYLMPTRFFELAVGATLAYWPRSHVGRSGSLSLSLAGVAFILYASLTYDSETRFPGFAALVPVVGTALLLRWGEGNAVGRLLSTRGAVIIGRVSYPAYLWHWPIITFLHINEVPLSFPVGVLVLVATLVLSWLTYRGLEMPARRLLVKPARSVVAGGAGMPVAASLALALILVRGDGVPARFPESLVLKEQAIATYPHKLRGGCNEGPPAAPAGPDDCILGRPNGPVEVLLVGDSHANHFSGFVDELAKAGGLRGYDMTRSNAPFLSGVSLAMPNEPQYNASFAARNDYVARHLESTRYKVIVLGGAWANFHDRDIVRGSGGEGGENAFEQGFREALIRSRRAAERVVVLTSIPQLPAGFYDCPLRRARSGDTRSCSIPLADHLKAVSGVQSVFERMKAVFPDVIWVDPDQLMCDREACVTQLDGIPLYKDSGHLNDVGSRLLAGKWLAQFGNPLLASAPGDAAQATNEAQR